jgi:hypothetical protein
MGSHEGATGRFDGSSAFVAAPPEGFLDVLAEPLGALGDGRAPHLVAEHRGIEERRLAFIHRGSHVTSTHLREAVTAPRLV